MAKITKDFLEKALRQPIESFRLNSGSNVGDGYTSIMYTIDVTLFGKNDGEKEDRVKHFLLKCYPVHPGRQEWLSNANLFQKELLTYKILIPELIRVQKNAGKNGIIQPPFPDFIFGQAVDYTNKKDIESMRCPDILENCIMMPDLRKTAGFKLADRLVGVDLDHSKLIWTAYAQVHSLGWVYKQLHKLGSLKDKFPFLHTSCFDSMDDSSLGIFYESSCDLFISTVEENVNDPKEKGQLIESIRRARGTSLDVMKLYLCDTKTVSSPSVTKDSIQRVPKATKDNEAPWLTVVHGDCWVNNMMFRYDENGKPVEIKLIDLQLTREADPMTDLAYSFYTSTTSEFRNKHLADLQKLYVDTFCEICTNFGVDPFSGFGLTEMKRRFHRAKSIGFVMALIGYKIFLSEAKDIKDLDEMSENATGDDFIKELMSNTEGVKGSQRFNERVLGIVRELHGEGVI